jgi:hypothetical protein
VPKIASVGDHHLRAAAKLYRPSDDLDLDPIEQAFSNLKAHLRKV